MNALERLMTERLMIEVRSRKRQCGLHDTRSRFVDATFESFIGLLCAFQTANPSSYYLSLIEVSPVSSQLSNCGHGSVCSRDSIKGSLGRWCKPVL